MSMSMTNTENRTPIRVGFYDIEKTIGKGNFAVVKLARHRLTKNEVAIKIIDKTQLQAPDLRRAYREVRVLKKLYHPHIIRLYQVMETKNMLYIVTEYAPKGEIFEHIASNGRLPEPFARRIYWQVVSAVDYCHKRGVVHRDLKAENLLFDAEGSVKLADFGFSTWWSQDAMLSTWCGSPPYAAPEVFEGRQYMGPEIDIWSLGVVLYVLVCGALPFDASTLPALRDRVLSARFRVPYFMSAECEALVRRMLMRDPTRRYNIDQVKQHGWMQADKPPRLLPAPGQPPPANVHKQYLDPGLAPDVLEPNEQILRLMASLGIDSARTKESLQQQSYDHHAAIYFLLLERLRQHPGGKLTGGSIASRPTPGAVRMLSTDSSTCRKMPRRPSTVAEAAMRKMNPGPSTAPDAPPVPLKAQYPPGTAAVQGSSTQDHTFWKTHRPVHAKVGQSSHTSSVDEGVADMDSSWDQQDFGGSVGTIDRGSSASSGFVQSNASASASIASRSDWKWPAPGCSSYSNQTSSADSPRASGSPGESVHGSSTTLSSWDSSWGATGLAGSMPSCPPTQQTSVDSNNSRSTRRLSSIDTETPRSPDACLTTGRLWIPEVNPPAIPTEFTLGRRASDGLIGGRRIGHFTNRLTGARAGGIATLTETDDNSVESVSGRPRSSIHSEDSLPPPDSQFFILCSPAKRPSLPDARKGSMLPSNYGLAPVREPGPSQQPQPPSQQQQQWTSPGTSHLHKQLMSLRLQRRSGVNESPGEMIHSSEPTEHGRKAVLRQQSYKLAQQQPVLSPLHSQSNYPCFPIDLESCIFRPIGSDEASDRTRLHCHEEEQEEDEEEEHCSGMGASGGIGSHGSVGGMTGNLQLSDLSRTASPWSMSIGNPRDSSNSWQNLPVTMGDCRLTDSNSSLSRLSPLLQYSDISSSNYNHPSHPHHSTPPPPLAYDPPPSLSYDWNPANSAPAQTFLPNSQQSMSSMMMNPEHDTTKDN